MVLYTHLMGTARGCHFLCLRVFSHRTLSFWCRPCCITMDSFFSEHSSLMDDPDLYSLDLYSNQLFPEAKLNFQPVQLFQDIEPPQAPLCDPDQFLAQSYSLPPLSLNQDCHEQIIKTPTVGRLFLRDLLHYFRQRSSSDERMC